VGAKETMARRALGGGKVRLTDNVDLEDSGDFGGVSFVGNFRQPQRASGLKRPIIFQGRSTLAVFS